MGKGLSALTFDKDYQKKRRDALNKKPASMQEGLARGGKGLCDYDFSSYILLYFIFIFLKAWSWECLME